MFLFVVYVSHFFLCISTNFEGRRLKAFPHLHQSLNFYIYFASSLRSICFRNSRANPLAMVKGVVGHHWIFWYELALKIIRVKRWKKNTRNIWYSRGLTCIIFISYRWVVRCEKWASTIFIWIYDEVFEVSCSFLVDNTIHIANNCRRTFLWNCSSSKREETESKERNVHMPIPGIGTD